MQCDLSSNKAKETSISRGRLSRGHKSRKGKQSPVQASLRQLGAQVVSGLAKGATENLRPYHRKPKIISAATHAAARGKGGKKEHGCKMDDWSDPTDTSWLEHVVDSYVRDCQLNSRMGEWIDIANEANVTQVLCSKGGKREKERCDIPVQTKEGTSEKQNTKEHAPFL